MIGTFDINHKSMRFFENPFNHLDDQDFDSKSWRYNIDKDIKVSTAVPFSHNENEST